MPVLPLDGGRMLFSVGYYIFSVSRLPRFLNLSIADVLKIDPETAPFFFEIGMHCLGCPHSRGESIAEACAVHGTDADALVKKINDYLAAK